MKKEDSAEAARKDFIEAMGFYFEDMAGPRMAGRILGLLIVSPDDAVSSSDILRSLKASKASVSTMARLLVHMNLIERVSVPGKRGDHFRMKDDCFTLMLQDSARQAGQMHQLAEKASKNSNLEPIVKARLDDMHLFWEFIETTTVQALKKWEKQKPLQK
jgi:DNA-binding transcriptional regulator GbsR (MarR family)